jgi:hypothetical protein
VRLGIGPRQDLRAPVVTAAADSDFRLALAYQNILLQCGYFTVIQSLLTPVGSFGPGREHLDDQFRIGQKRDNLSIASLISWKVFIRVPGEVKRCGVSVAIARARWNPAKVESWCENSNAALAAIPTLHARQRSAINRALVHVGIACL